MSGWSPPTVDRNRVAAIGLLYALFVGYTLLVLQQLLLGLFPGLLLVGGYFAWRLLRAIEAIADALQRIAAEREADGDRNRTR